MLSVWRKSDHYLCKWQERGSNSGPPGQEGNALPLLGVCQGANKLLLKVLSTVNAYYMYKNNISLEFILRPKIKFCLFFLFDKPTKIAETQTILLPHLMQFFFFLNIFFIRIMYINICWKLTFCLLS
jgi:hypothetical protein